MSPDDQSQPKPPRRPLWRRMTDNPLFHLVAALVVTSLVLSFVAKPYRVPSSSMQQTLQVGDRVLVNRLAYPDNDPEHGPQTGDVIVFDADETWGPHQVPTNPVRVILRKVGELTGYGPSGYHTLVKRVIAGPGQTVSCCSPTGAIMVDGVPLDEPYVHNDFAFEPGVLDCSTTPRSARCLPEVVVPEDAYLVLGDNRSNSADSAVYCRGGDAATDCYLLARRDQVVGRVVAIIWPPGNWSGNP
ncbi:MAG: signal peptidase I [Brooklawnia sp.]